MLSGSLVDIKNNSDKTMALFTLNCAGENITLYYIILRDRFLFILNFIIINTMHYLDSMLTLLLLCTYGVKNKLNKYHNS